MPKGVVLQGAQKFYGNLLLRMGIWSVERTNVLTTATS